MKRLRQFVEIELAALAALALVAVSVGVVAQLLEQGLHNSGGFESAGHAWFFGTLVVGAPIVVLFGGPAYFVLRYLSFARWGAVAAVGALPGVWLLPMSPMVGLLGLGCGITVACLTHLVCRSRV